MPRKSRFSTPGASKVLAVFPVFFPVNGDSGRETGSPGTWTTAIQSAVQRIFLRSDSRQLLAMQRTLDRDLYSIASCDAFTRLNVPEIGITFDSLQASALSRPQEML
jgi:hypothetical protein